MRRPYSKDPKIESSLRHSIRDAAGYSVMFGGGETYLSAFAVFLKASTAQIGFLASIPPLLGSLAQLLSAWFGRGPGRRKRIIVAGACLQALVWLPLVALPLLWPSQAVTLLIACVVIYHAMGNLISPQWTSLMGDIVPERKRGRFFATRTRVAMSVVFLAMVAAGGLLHFFELHGRTGYGFIAVCLIAALGRIVSAYQLSRMHDPGYAHGEMERLSLGQWLERLRSSQFARFAVFFSLMQGSTMIAAPFFTLYMLRDLEFSYLQFMATTATAVLFQFLSIRMWGRVADAFGNRLVLGITAALISVLPLLWLVSADFWYLIGIQVLGGISWAGFSLSAGNYAYDLVPAPKRLTYMALQNVMAATAVFAGAMLGGYLGTILPREIIIGGHAFISGSALLGVFAVSSAARGLVAVMLLPRLREVRSVRALTATGLVLRMARIIPLTGLLFDIIRVRRPEREWAEKPPLPRD